MFVPFQGLVTFTNMAIDFSQQLDPARKSFCKNVMWENRGDLGSVGKDGHLLSLNLSSGTATLIPQVLFGPVLFQDCLFIY